MHGRSILLAEFRQRRLSEAERIAIFTLQQPFTRILRSYPEIFQHISVA
jgi:hypothetical protein